MNYRLFLIVFVFLACNKTSEKTLLAEVNGQKLYLENIESSIPTLQTNLDSTTLINQLVEDWSKKNLLLEMAKSKVNQNDIDKLVDNYRNDLIIADFERTLISQKLDTVVSAAQIKTFIERNNIEIEKAQEQVKVKFGKVRSNKPDLEKLDNLWKEEKWEEISSYCGTFAEICMLKDEWISLTELKQYFSDETFSSDVLKKKGYNQKSKNRYEYFLSILDYRKEADEMTSNAKNKVRKLILHQRAKELLKSYKAELYQKSLNDQKIKFYLN